MAITNYSAARRAGFKVTNKGVKKAAAIAMSKIGTRTLYYSLSPDAFCFNGASVAKSADGIFAVITLPDANTGYIATAFRLPAEWISANIMVTIYWKTTAVANAAKFVVDLGSKADSESTASSNQQTVTATTNTTANKLNKSQVTFAAALSATGDWIGLKILRDPADGADLLSADLKIAGVVVEFTGRG